MKNFKYWTMRDGGKIKISEMSNSHLENSMKMLERRAWKMKLATELEMIAFESMCSGDGATYAAGCMVADMQATSDIDFLIENTIYGSLLREKIRREENEMEFNSRRR